MSSDYLITIYELTSFQKEKLKELENDLIEMRMWEVDQQANVLPVEPKAFEFPKTQKYVKASNEWHDKPEVKEFNDELNVKWSVLKKKYSVNGEPIFSAFIKSFCWINGNGVSIDCSLDIDTFVDWMEDALGIKEMGVKEQ